MCSTVKDDVAERKEVISSSNNLHHCNNVYFICILLITSLSCFVSGANPAQPALMLWSHLYSACMYVSSVQFSCCCCAQVSSVYVLFIVLFQILSFNNTFLRNWEQLQRVVDRMRAVHYETNKYNNHYAASKCTHTCQTQPTLILKHLLSWWIYM